MTIKARAYARAGFLGNPSDGYNGKTISIALTNFAADVSIQQSNELRIEAQDSDRTGYKSVEDLVSQVKLYGYYGAERLLKATIRKFYEYCVSNGISLEAMNFTMRFHSSIPRQVGLGGSSAIVTAAMRCLMEFYGVAIPLDALPSLTLKAETTELGINAGLQDRVIQAHGGCMYMNFARELIEKNGHGDYRQIDPGLLPPLFIAYKTGLGKVSGAALSDISIGYVERRKDVLETLQRIAEIADEGEKALIDGDLDRIFDLMNENFDQRSRIMKINEGNREMIDLARSLGASAKFAGSGGSIIGMYRDDGTFDALVKAFHKIDATVVKPAIA